MSLTGAFLARYPIVRIGDPGGRDESTITLAEWLAVVASDPSLEPWPAFGPGCVRWRPPMNRDEGHRELNANQPAGDFFIHQRGRIVAESTSRQVLEKLREIAFLLRSSPRSGGCDIYLGVHGGRAGDAETPGHKDLGSLLDVTIIRTDDPSGNHGGEITSQALPPGDAIRSGSRGQ
jgi:hypothetical protein